MKETSQVIAAVKREVQLSEWQRQIQERQEQGRTVDEWCISLGISKGTYYHRLRKVRKYMCQSMGVTYFRWVAALSAEGNRSAGSVGDCRGEIQEGIYHLLFAV